MFQFEKYDFSKETNIEDKLFNKMKDVYEKVKNKERPLSDDDLEFIFAANGIEEKKCPFLKEDCTSCEYYMKNSIGKGFCRINSPK